MPLGPPASPLNMGVNGGTVGRETAELLSAIRAHRGKVLALFDDETATLADVMRVNEELWRLAP